ncbi:MAG: hypothetical protein H8E34_09255 [Bacteroidetes bacterium]|nr:hypothetical protein [Bacteroidota bacterium]MBL6942878.1 hypothetical protein [Bacteroidales bacterium]
MLPFFKRNQKKTSKKGASFYHRENIIQTIEELNKVLSYLNSPDTIKSKTNIIFKGYELDTINEKNLEDNFGEESFLLEPKSGLENHKVYFYRINQKMKKQYAGYAKPEAGGELKETLEDLI